MYKRKKPITQRRLICFASLLLALFLSASACSYGSTVPSASSTARGDLIPLDLSDGYGFITVAETDALELMIHAETTEMAVMVKSTGVIWYSNPMWGDDYGTPKNHQIKLEYFDGADKRYTLDNYSDSAEFGAYEVFSIPGGVRITYTLGVRGRTYIAPKIVEKTRFEELVSQMGPDDREYITDRYILKSLQGVSEAERREILEQFPIVAEHEVYACPQNLAGFLMEILEETFTRYGYTAEDLEYDNRENGIPEPEKPLLFTAPLEYTLDGGALTARIPWSEAEYDDKLAIVSKVSLLEFFGAGGEWDGGYMLLPDGAGALVRFNNGKGGLPLYEKPVYGENSAIYRHTKNVDTLNCQFPVFGVKKYNAAFLAFIESGAENANLNVRVYGQEGGYNRVFSSFDIRKGNLEWLEYSNAQVYRFSPKQSQADITVRYMFLSGEEADYSGMARLLRGYLEERGMLRERGGETRLWINLIGALDYTDSFFGVPVTGYKGLTNYAQAVEILSELRGNGAGHLAVKYSDWHNGGSKSTLPDSVSFLRALGKPDDFRDLAAYCRETGVRLYPDVDFQYFRKNRLFDAFYVYRDNARYFTGETAYYFENYDLSTSTRDHLTKKHIIKPSAYGRFIDSYMADYEKLGVPSLGVSNLAASLYADYSASGPLNRDESAILVVNELEKLYHMGYSLSASGANCYALPYLDAINELPNMSSRFYIFDDEVPFMQMVLRGRTEYSSEPLNFMADYETEALRAIEYCSIPSFCWIYADNSELKETDYNYHSMHYRVWLDRAARLYEDCAAAYEGLEGRTIYMHERLTETVSVTRFDNGAAIYVNYSYTDYAAVDGIVPARGFLRV